MHMVQGRRNQSFVRFIQSDNTTNAKLLQTWYIFGKWHRTQQQKLENKNESNQLNASNQKTYQSH